MRPISGPVIFPIIHSDGPSIHIFANLLDYIFNLSFKSASYSHSLSFCYIYQSLKGFVQELLMWDQGVSFLHDSFSNAIFFLRVLAIPFCRLVIFLFSTRYQCFYLVLDPIEHYFLPFSKCNSCSLILDKGEFLLPCFYSPFSPEIRFVSTWNLCLRCFFITFFLPECGPKRLWLAVQLQQ